MSFFVSKKRDEEFRCNMMENPIQAFNPETGLKTNRLNTGFNDKEGQFNVTLVGDSKRVCNILLFFFASGNLLLMVNQISK